MIFRRAGASKKPRASGSGSRPAQESQTPSNRRRPVPRLVVVAAYVVLVAALTRPVLPGKAIPEYDVDSQPIAEDTIRAEFPFTTVNLQATREAEDDAAANVPDTYRVDRSPVQEQIKAFQERVEAVRAQQDGVEKAIRQALMASDETQSAAEVLAKATLAYAGELLKDPRFEGLGRATLLAVWLTPNPDCVPVREYGDRPKAGDGSPRKAASLGEPKKTPFELANVGRLSEIGQATLRSTLSFGILKSSDLAGAGAANGARILVLRDRPEGDLNQSEDFTRADAPTLANARRRLSDEIKKGVQSLAGKETASPVDWTQLEGAAFAMASLALGETLVLDPVATDDAREAARRAVQPALKSIVRNQVIQAGGYPWTEQSRSDYKTYISKRLNDAEPATAIVASLLSHMILVALVLLCLVKSLLVLASKRRDPYESLALALLIMCGVLIVGRIVSYFDVTGLSAPAAAGAILIVILANARLSAMTSFLTAILLSIQFNYSWQVLVVSAAMSFAGLLSVFRVRRRMDMGNACIKAAIVGLITVGSIALATGTHPTSVVELQDLVLRDFGLVALNGLVCLFVVPGLLPPLERLFGITTDIQLLEYSDLNNEVLSRLAVEVPGTHAHSLRVGELAEAAAEAVGANGLLARVCAFYHDIGKLRRPQYFAENQNGVNVHDDLAPRLSARAVASHVTEGAEMARESHLPKPIVDGILEHQGTCLISFFYQEALAQQKHGDVREEDFRYPGPKPQSRETAILMICDAAESGVRSIKNANEERIHEMVDKLISARAADRQFDECHLTLKELDTIGEVVVRRIVSNFHRRVEYPDDLPEKPAGNGPSDRGGPTERGGQAERGQSGGHLRVLPMSGRPKA